MMFQQDLEAEVETEQDVVAIQVDTHHVAAVAITLGAEAVEAYETNVSNKANLVVEVDSHTWTETKIELSANILDACQANATIYKHVDILGVPSGVTHVGIYRKNLGIHILTIRTILQVASALLIAEGNTSSPLAVEVPTNFRNELVSGLGICATILHTCHTNRTTKVALGVNTNSHCDCN